MSGHGSQAQSIQALALDQAKRRDWDARPKTLPYESAELMGCLVKHLREFCGPDQIIIRRAAFRWFDADGNVLSNHFEGMSLASIADSFGYTVVHDFNHAAIVEKVRS